MKVDIYTTKGKKNGTAEVSDVVFAAKKNDDLVHQVVVSMQSNARSAIAHTKDRSDVRGGGKKPWKQKGTGRARHGSSRSPIWRGGGVTFGPTNEKNFSKKINSKMRARALHATLSEKMRTGQVLFIDKIELEAPKTAAAKVIIEALIGVKGFKSLAAKHNAAIVFVTEKNENITKSFANFSNIDVKEVRNANPIDVLTHKNVIIVDAEAASAVLESRITK
ncbi:MAG: 50S ribosomal protein L4 [Candidatus Pacebacteria bacterium]|nr:50S ribosomal protein L4 [Candidatus Paceibacterota bacterium]